MLLGLNVNYSNHHKRATALNNIAVAIIFVSMSLSLLLTFMKKGLTEKSHLRSNQAFIVMYVLNLISSYPPSKQSLDSSYAPSKVHPNFSYLVFHNVQPLPLQ